MTYTCEICGDEFEDHPFDGIDPFATERIEVEETGHEVRSSWEAELDRMLHEAGIDYDYEAKRFELEPMTYIPDFRVGSQMIEVKGPPSDRAIRQAEAFMEEFPEYEYVVLGTRIPCDKHYEWEEREKMVEDLKDE